MSSPLYYSAMYLLDKVSNLPWSPYIYTVNPYTGQICVQSNSKKRLFFILLTVFVFTTTILTPILLTAKYIYNPETVRGFTVTIYFVIFSFGFITMTTALLGIASGHEIMQYTKELVNFEARLRGNRVTIPDASKPLFLFLVDHIKLHNSEIQKLLRRDPNPDLVGILQSSNVLNLMLLEFLLPVPVYMKVDPVYVILHDLLELNLPYFSPFMLIVRLVAQYFTFLEIKRTCTFAAGWGLWNLFVFNDCIDLIQSRTLAMSVINEYMHLRILMKHIDWYIQLLVGAHIGVVFFLCMLLNCFIVIGWKLFDGNVYLLSLPTGIIIELMWMEGLTLTVRIHERSKVLVEIEWPRMTEKLYREGKILSMFTIKRKIRMQMPISFRCFTFAIMNQESKQSSYEYLMDYTMDLLLLFQDNLEKLGRKRKGIL